MKSVILGVHSPPHSPTLTLAPTLLKMKCNFVFQVKEHDVVVDHKKTWRIFPPGLGFDNSATSSVKLFLALHHAASHATALHHTSALHATALHAATLHAVTLHHAIPLHAVTLHHPFALHAFALHLR